MRRTSTLHNLRNAYNNVNNNYNKVSELNGLIGSDNKFSSFNELEKGSNIKLLTELNKINEEAETYLQNIHLTKLKILNAREVIKDVIEIAESFHMHLLRYQPNIVPFSEGEMKQIIEVDLYHLKGLLNSKNSNYYIFSGSKSDVPPVGTDLLDPQMQSLNDQYYQGDDFSTSIKLKEHIEIHYNVNANNLAFVKLIAALNTVYYNLGSESKLKQADDLVSECIDDLIGVESNLMVNYALLDKYENYWKEEMYNAGSNYHELEEEYNLSITDLFSELAIRETMLDASQAMFNKIASMHLLDV